MTQKYACLALLFSACNSAWADHALQLPDSTVSAIKEQPSGLVFDQPIKTGSRLGPPAKPRPR